MSKTKKIIVALSGGVDSSVAAYLLRKKNPSIPLQGIFMNNWSAADEDNDDNIHTHKNNTYCLASERDYQDAQDVCNKLEIPLQKVNFAAEYWTQVFEPFIEGLENGLTPNPDIWCNSKIKFGVLKDYAMNNLGASGIATGHYARVWDTSKCTHLPDYLEHALATYNNSTSLQLQQNSNNSYPSILDYITKPKSSIILLAAKDLTKDQTYFLCQTPGASFQNVHFPIGDYIKQNNNNKYNLHDNGDGNGGGNNSVRSIAMNQLGLTRISKKRESYGICFIGKRNFQKFIPGYIDKQVLERGNFICVDTGRTVGTHNGTNNTTSLYTIGQRAKISGGQEKWYIVGKYTNKNVIWVCDDTHHPALYSDELYVNVGDMNWIAGDIPQALNDGGRIRVQCRTRHLQPVSDADIYWDAQRSHYTIHFDNPIRAITPGQTIALYVAGGLVCLGGGSICDRGLSHHERGLKLDFNNNSSALPPSSDLKNRTALDHLKDWGIV